MILCMGCMKKLTRRNTMGYVFTEEFIEGERGRSFFHMTCYPNIFWIHGELKHKTWVAPGAYKPDQINIRRYFEEERKLRETKNNPN